MVRQDKISHLITGFNSTQLEPIFPDETLVDLFIRTILSQGTKDELRDRAFQNLKSSFPNWTNLLNLDSSKISELIKVSGLAKQKSQSILQFIEWVHSNFNNFDLEPIRNWQKERIFSELTAITGIGNKTVSIFICFGLKQSSFPVDVHVHRILTRIGVTSNYKNPDKVFMDVDPFIPVGKEFFLHAHLVEHGKNMCKNSNPNCKDCMFNNHCDYYFKKNEWADN